ncbi:hypothetical protein WR25_04652 [Diploscapter pachys]|uniref:Uncharacterized protein n=1 Tax=Diploscapter pachys TaxID=2018661 RepID=A0A2A2KHK9_9BILA|nr:hypothetical protein WR25_04652 [Diploscapter pachys]
MKFMLNRAGRKFPAEQQQLKQLVRMVVAFFDVSGKEFAQPTISQNFPRMCKRSTRQHVPIGNKPATSASVSGSNEKVGKTNSCPAQKSTDCSKPSGIGLSRNPPKPQAPTDTGSKAPTFDPNYMTLNSLNNDCFTKK